MLDGEASEKAPQEGAADGDDVVGALGFAALAARIRDSSFTTAEVRAACTDLQVLGRSEFKALLKWWGLLLLPGVAHILASCPAVTIVFSWLPKPTTERLAVIGRYVLSSHQNPSWSGHDQSKHVFKRLCASLLQITGSFRG